MKKVLPVVMLSLLLAGCGPWMRTEGPHVSESLNISMDLPLGWMRQNTQKVLLITKDGVMLQEIVAGRMELGEEKQFPHTKKRIAGDMLPQELAEVVLDDFQSNQYFREFVVEENLPATVGGIPGFKTRFSYQIKSGLKYRCTYYGALSGGYLYSVFYLAAARHYFPRDFDTFEKAVATFKLLKS